MGLLSSIGNLALKAAANFTTAIQKPVSYVSATFQDVTKGGNRAATLVETQTSKPLTSQIGSILTSTGTAALAVVGGGALAGSKVATQIVKAATPAIVKTAKALVPATTKGKVVAAVVAPSAATLLLGSSKARETTTGALKSIVTGSVGTDVAKTIEGKQSILETISAHPIAAGATALGAAVVLGKGLTTAGAIAAGNLLDDDTKIIQTEQAQPATNAPIKVTYPASDDVAASPMPVTPQTAPMAKTTSAVKKRTRKAQKPSIISQKVNVMVNNSHNEKYINRRIYA
jgi:hypothetical protein